MDDTIKQLTAENNSLRNYIINLQQRLIEQQGEEALPTAPAALHQPFTQQAAPTMEMPITEVQPGIQRVATTAPMAPLGGEKREHEDDSTDRNDQHPAKKQNTNGSPIAA